MQNSHLSLVVQESGLEQTKAQIVLEKFTNYFELASEWEQKAKTLSVTSVDQVAEMKMAREGRLFLREKRLEVEKTRKELKEEYLRGGRAVDGIANILKSLIEPIESYLDEQEHYAERIKEEKRKALLQERKEKITELGQNPEDYVGLADMQEAQWNALVKGLEAEKIKAEAEAKRLEEERVAKEKAEKAEQERIKKENEELREEMEKQKAKQLKELEAQRAQQQKELEEQQRMLYAEREAKAKAEAELKAQQETEAAKRAKVEEDAKKAASASDKEKLITFANSLTLMTLPPIDGAEAKEIVAQVGTLLEKLSNFIIKKAESL